MMKKCFALFLLLVVKFCWALTAAEDVQDKLNAIRSMSASFQQVVKVKHKQVSHSSGTMALKRPGRFRWDTKDPMEQLVVADGKHMWVYDVDLEQVTVKRQDNGVGTTAGLFLSGYNNDITKDYDVRSEKQGQQVAFDMKSKNKKANFQRIKLIFDNNTLTGIDLYDQLGQITSVRLSKVKSNLDLKSSLFQFKPPKGVDVVEQ